MSKVWRGLRSLVLKNMPCIWARRAWPSSGFGKSQLQNFQRTQPENSKIEKRNLPSTRQTSRAGRDTWITTAHAQNYGNKNHRLPNLKRLTVAWSPHTAKDVFAIESIQRRAARFVVNDYSRNSSVSAMLADLTWQSVEERRIINDLTMFQDQFLVFTWRQKKLKLKISSFYLY